VREAAPGQRAGLRLGTGDFAAVEADAAKQLPASGAAGEAAYDAVVKYNAEVSDAAFLRGVSFKDLGGGGGGLSDYVQLSNRLGPHMTAASWHIPHFMRVVRVLRKAVLTKEGVRKPSSMGVARGEDSEVLNLSHFCQKNRRFGRAAPQVNEDFLAPHRAQPSPRPRSGKE